jgi:hypothetical protein
MKLNKPDFTDENIGFSVSEIWEFLGNFIHWDTSLFFITTISDLDLGNQVINKWSEVTSNWKINKNILENFNETFRCKASNTLKSLELTEWVHLFDQNADILIVHAWDVWNNIFNLVLMHHLLQEHLKAWRRISHDIFNLISELCLHSSFKLIDLNFTIWHLDVFAIVSFIQDKFELVKGVAWL